MLIQKTKCISERPVLRKLADRLFSSNVAEEAKLSNGRSVRLSTGKLARFADGAAVASLGETSVMVTAVSKAKSTNTSFLPLVVDYRQKAAAAGRIPTNFLRRELGATEKEILTSRMIDRSLRPLFPVGYFYETQVMCNLLAVDGVYDPEVLSINAASAALSISDIPWNGPVAAVRVAYIDNEVIINPTRQELAHSDLNLVVSASKDNLIVMLEASGNNLENNKFIKCIEDGVAECQIITKSIERLQSVAGKPKREVQSIAQPDEETRTFLKMLCVNKLRDIFSDFTHDKISRDVSVSQVRAETLEKVRMNFPTADPAVCSEYFNKILKEIFRNLIFETERRCDGRLLTEVRPISCEVNLQRPLHGSSLFQRGQTQVFSTVAFDSPDSAMKGDALSVLLGGLKEKNFFLHYEFPPYATNETGRAGAYGRREIGHGALAEKGLRPVIPSNFPFTIRLTSEVLESNGSSSMATVCGGSMALMDAGVQISSPAAGVAIGLVTKLDEEKNKSFPEYKILTDLLGIEDYLGDMDFKIAGTGTGITALQADIKLPGITMDVVSEAIYRAHDAKKHILDIMKSTIPVARLQRKDNWPVTEKLEVPVHKRSRLFGLGGGNLKKLTAVTGVQVHHPSALGLDAGKEITVKYFGRDPVSGKMRLSRKVLLGTASPVAKSLNNGENTRKSS
ncbi:polyribonucleotide nucleotidyltransferase 1, mitochondrial-like isoform X2 [Artemia franciscana]|uniref:polyribonucleotide nucleotidyltransferase 1, mitochondrial-like isoform X2 n=1 Tax=Artemia franciscana TaxID=6661 RepID=UPI0032DADF4F